MDMLRAAHEALFATAGDLDDGRLRRRPAAGGWSALDVLEHVARNEEITAEVLGRASGLRVVEPPPPDPPLALALVRTRHIEAPDVVRPQGTYTSLAEARSALDASAARLAQRYAALDDALLDGRGMRHSVFGFLTVRQWHDLCALHALRHLQQLHEIVTGA